MKKVLLLFLFSFLIGGNAVAQLITQLDEDKSIVYFIRPSSEAFLIKFDLFDDENYIGKLSSSNYIAYKCNPGRHIFVAKGENTDHIEADLEANKIYVIAVEVQMGVVKARVKCTPLNPQDKKYEKKEKTFIKLINKKKKGNFIAQYAENNINESSPHMKKLEERKQKNKKIKQLTSDVYIDHNKEQNIEEIKEDTVDDIYGK